jgi:hypothetical protein
MNVLSKVPESNFFLFLILIRTIAYFLRAGYVESEMYFVFGLGLAYIKSQHKFTPA